FVILLLASTDISRAHTVDPHSLHLYRPQLNPKPTRSKRMSKTIIRQFLQLCLYNLSKPHSGQRSGGPTASTLNIISVSFSCGGSIVLMSGRDNKSDILFILYYSAVLRYQL